jgi:O-glycosyl hydrolase
MESDLSAYIWWYGKRYSSFIGDGESAYGTTVGTPLKRRYAFSQYATHVRPGYQRVAAGQPTSLNGGQVTVSLPARSISTVVLTHPSGVNQ